MIIGTSIMSPTMAAHEAPGRGARGTGRRATRLGARLATRLGARLGAGLGPRLGAGLGSGLLALTPLLADPAPAAEQAEAPFEIRVDGLLVPEGALTPEEPASAHAPGAPPLVVVAPVMDVPAPNAGSPEIWPDADPLVVPAPIAPELRVEVDGLDLRPRLAVGAARAPDGRVDFETYWNYADFIAAGEVRVTALEDGRLLTVLPLDAQGRTSWRPDAHSAHASSLDGLPEGVGYALRVYDASGAFDETQVRRLDLSPAASSDAVADTLPEAIELDSIDPDVAAAPTVLPEIYGRDMTHRRTIRVAGAAVTLSGQAGPGETVAVAGRPVPLDPAGAFVHQEILPHGEGAVPVTVVGAGGATEVRHLVTVPETDVFYVAIGDLTVGRGDPARIVGAAGEYDETFVEGRAAFYLRGKVKGRYLVTMAADTDADAPERLLTNGVASGPRALLRRLDPDRFYPVYGDQSALEQDAPTQGQLYVRVQRDDSSIMWGNFATGPQGTDLARLDRGLYGAKADYASPAVTADGERRTRVTAYAADPGTLPARDVLRGTGGSVYYLRRRDIVIGSERLTVERRDPVTGLVREARLLEPDDYEIDYIQGRILLDRPLRSSLRDGAVVRDGAGSGDPMFLVAAYEYAPLFDEVEGYTLGARGTRWVGDHVRLGATAQREATADADQTVIAADVTVQRDERNFVKAEIARTDGPVAFDRARSANGGLSYADDPDLVRTGEAYGARVEGAAELEWMTRGALAGHLTGYAEHRDEGFSGTGLVAPYDTTRWGADVTFDPARNVRVQAGYDEARFGNRGAERQVEGEVSLDVAERWTASVGALYDWRETGPDGLGGLDGLTVSHRSGSRTTLGARLGYRANDALEVYGFGQGTLAVTGARARDHRGGLGGAWHLSERVDVSGEVSGGTQGLGLDLGARYRIDEGSDLELGYALSATGEGGDLIDEVGPAGASLGTLTVRGNRRHSDWLSTFVEERVGLERDAIDLAQAYGVELDPGYGLAVSALVESGKLRDTVLGDFRRTSASATAGWSGEGMSASLTGEARLEDRGETTELAAWLGRTRGAYDATPDWTVSADLDVAVAQAGDAGTLRHLREASFIEASVAGAYRPVAHDRLNALARYTYFQDLTPADQFTGLGGGTLGPKQRSHVASLDVSYDLNRWLTLGAKYGLRLGEVSLGRASDAFVRSTAQLGVLRADVHVLKQWDLLLEGRALHVAQGGDPGHSLVELATAAPLALPAPEDMRLGALAAVYRHVGDNVKVGVGYSFSRFSDDLTDLSDTHEGVFLNVIGKL